MFEDGKKLVFGFLLAWVALFALCATFAIPQFVSPRLESVAREALRADTSLSSLTPHFKGLTGSFTGTLASAEQLERAYALAAPALPVGSFLRQPPEHFVLPQPSVPVALVSDTPVAAPKDSEASSLPVSAEPAQALESTPPSAVPVSIPVTTQVASAPPPAPSVPMEPAPAPAQIAPEPPVAAPAPAPSTASATITDSPPILLASSSGPASAPIEAAAPSPSTPTPAPVVADPAPPVATADSPVAAPVSSSPREVDEWTGTVFFQTDSSNLQDSQLPILKRIVEDSKSRPDYRLRIVGFADPRGDQDFNTWLSRRRAARVQSELAQLGVNLPVELAVDLESPNSPILDNPEIQRRVELRYIK